MADYIIEVLGDEAERRGEQSRARQRLRAVRDAIRRLKVQERELELPPVTMESSLVDPGKIDLILRNLSEEQVKKVLSILHLDVTPSNSSHIWDHLLGDDLV